MGHKKRDKVTSADLKGFKYFKLLAGMLKTLHDTGCERDRAHNRTLHRDQYMTLLLMFMFNPICSSLRALQEASALKKVQRTLRVPRASLGSLSEAARVFDSDLLVGIIGALAERLSPVCHDTRLADVDQMLMLVDGSWLRAVPKMTWALFQDPQHPAIKAHVQFELLKGVPVAGTITAANTGERTVLADALQAGRLYVLDRGYAEYELLQKIIDADSSFVCRVQDSAVFEVIEERELSKAALDEGVVRDAVVWLGSKATRKALRQPVRIVEVECTPYRKPSGKTGRGGPEQGDTLLLVTDRMDLPPETIALIYQNRWQIEIFFRFFKHVLGCRHLIRECANGIELKTYRMVSWYFSGWADADELQRHIDGLARQDPRENVA